MIVDEWMIIKWVNIWQGGEKKVKKKKKTTWPRNAKCGNNTKLCQLVTIPSTGTKDSHTNPNV